MAFSPGVKARIFIRCARICCLCFKQCGTRIEAAHIVSELEGGSNEDDNAIPVCFDCHEEIGSYNPKHPRGNKFSEQELRERRNALYALVEQGLIQAQIVAHRFERRHAFVPTPASTEDVEREAARPRRPSAEALAVLDEARKAFAPVETLPRKLGLLSEEDRAFIVDRLVDSAVEGPAVSALMLLIDRKALGGQETIVLEHLLRKVTLQGDYQARARLMNLAPILEFASTDPELRSMFFEDAFEIMRRDQFTEVNAITPAVVRAQAAVPPALYKRYFEALLDQASSSAWQGGPAARNALVQLPDEIAQAGFDLLDANLLFLHSHHGFVREFLANHSATWPNQRLEIYRDYVSLSAKSFAIKYLGWDET